MTFIRLEKNGFEEQRVTAFIYSESDICVNYGNPTPL